MDFQPSALLRPATRTMRIAAGALAVALIAGLVPALRFANLQLPFSPAFLPMFGTAVILLDGLTWLLTATQGAASDDPFLSGVASSYGFTTVLAVAQMLVFPGVFSNAGLFGAGMQTAVFLWVCWHLGFPLLMIMALAAREASKRMLPDRRALLVRRIMWVGPLSGLVCIGLALWAQYRLPDLIGHGGHFNLRHGLLTPLMLLLGSAALLGMISTTRLEHRLTLCLAIALLSNLCNSMLALDAPTRFSVGWYMGRVLSFISSAVVFAALLHEIVELYHQQRRLNALLVARVAQDGLTGVHSKAYFLDQFPRELMRAHRDRAPLALLMIDIDLFKRFNDHFGHVAGDVCLKCVADAITASVRRAGDFVVRFGGEEFAVVLPNTDSAGACRQAEAVCRAVRDLAIPAAELGKLVTVSAGAAVYDGVGGADPRQHKLLLEAADGALYAAKAAGRNCWRFAERGEHQSPVASADPAALLQFAEN